MSTSTYLEVVNSVLRGMNEVPLTTANFSNAVGLQAYVKDSVNQALFDINNESYK